jgi:hypothetical protein
VPPASAELESEASDSPATMLIVLFGRGNVVPEPEPLGVAALAVSFSVVEKV